MYSQMYGQSTRSLQPQPPVNAVHKLPHKMPGAPIPSSIPAGVPGSYPIHPDVRLKKLPFYEMMGELLKPSTLSKSYAEVFHLK